MGVAAAVASNSSGEGGDMQAASAGTPAAATTITTGSSDVPANVASARAWIGAWKRKHGKA